MNKKRVISLAARYLLLLLVAIPNFYIIYKIFTPLTIYPAFFLLKLFFNVSLSGTNLAFNNYLIQLVPACIAGSAYYLLLILNLATPMQIKTRVKSLLFLLLTFLAINIIRIFFFSVLFVKSFSLFNLIHMIFWYIISVAIVFLIWYANIKIFRIKDIPVYTDVRNLIKQAD